MALLVACVDGERGESASPSEQGAEPAAGGRATPLAYTVNYPLAYFAERIAGGLVEVRCPAPGDVDPAFWAPDADMVAEYQGADLILLNGAGYASWTDRVSLPDSRLVVTTDGASDRYVVEEDAVTHSHGPEGEHAHGTIAFTTWLDPTIAVEQARAIRDAFSGAWPEHEAAFSSGFEALEGDLLELDDSIARLVATDPDRLLLGSHPVYQYLAARYGLSMRSVHFEPDEAPSAAAWRDLRAILEEHPAGWMLWEAEPLPEIAAQLRELGVESVVFDPAGNRPEEGDYLAVMNENLRRLEAVYRAAPEQ